MAKYRIDKKTGRKKRVDPQRSRIAKRAARKRVNKRVDPQTKKKISRNLQRVNRTGRTKYGRRMRKRRR